LKAHANTFEITNIRSRDFKGLLKVHLAEPELMKTLRETHNLKIQMDVVLVVEDEKKNVYNFPLRTRPYVVTSEDMLREALAKMVTEIELRFDEKAMRKSNLKIKETKKITMHYTKYDPLKAGTFIALPDCIKNTKSCINIKNEDNFCFKYCVLCEVNKVYDKAHPEKVSAYKV
jgi:hypothetical protein